jgi:RHO1 GDP-GTP exchange protein 1/2
VASGKLVQVIEGQDIKLLYAGFASEDKTVLVGMKGDKDDEEGASYKIVDLVETQELQTPSTSSWRAMSTDELWDTWDM